MPGPVSDNYDPEWGTGDNAERIGDALQVAYDRVSEVLGNKKPMYILRLLDVAFPRNIAATLNEKTWRVIRFALERARDSI